MQGRSVGYSRRALPTRQWGWAGEGGGGEGGGVQGWGNTWEWWQAAGCTHTGQGMDAGSAKGRIGQNWVYSWSRMHPPDHESRALLTHGAPSGKLYLGPRHCSDGCSGAGRHASRPRGTGTAALVNGVGGQHEARQLRAGTDAPGHSLLLGHRTERAQALAAAACSECMVAAAPSPNQASAAAAAEMCRGRNSPRQDDRHRPDAPCSFGAIQPLPTAPPPPCVGPLRDDLQPPAGCPPSSARLRAASCKLLLLQQQRSPPYFT